jgi:uncharacterized membrane protein YjjB (DUF3815 family)
MNPLMSLWAAVAVLGFAMVFSVPRKTLAGVMAMSVGAHLLRSVALESGASLAVASGVAAVAVGLTAAVVAPRTGQATPIYAFAPVIPLIPGTHLFTALTAMLDLAAPEQQDVTATVNTVLAEGATAGLTILALAVGTIGPTLLVGPRLARLATGRPT